MTYIATVNFVDNDSGSNTLVFVRTVVGTIGLGVSLEDNGDIEVFFDSNEADQIISALEKAKASLNE